MRARNKDIKRLKNSTTRLQKSITSNTKHPQWRLYHEITWDNIKKFLSKKKNILILDAGGGTGYWAIKLVKLGYKVILTDISEEMSKVAEKKIKKEKLESKTAVKKFDIRDMSCFPSNYFDMSLLREILFLIAQMLKSYKRTNKSC